MLQKYIKTAVPREVLLEELLDFEQWTEWWPGVKRLAIVEEASSRVVIDLVLSMKKTLHLRLEIDRSRTDTILIKQLEGWFKHYTSEWQLLTNPDGSGTTLKVSTDIGCPPLVPKRMVYEALADSMEQFAENLHQRLANRRAEAPAARTAPESGAAGKRYAQLFETDDGLEVWVMGMPFVRK